MRSDFWSYSVYPGAFQKAINELFLIPFRREVINQEMVSPSILAFLKAESLCQRMQSISLDWLYL